MNTILILTSNLGANLFDTSFNSDFIKNKKGDIMNSVKSVLRAEFINRLDEILFFTKLSKLNIRKVSELELNNLQSKLQKLSIGISWTDEVVDLVSLEGYDPEFGARPIKRTIKNLIENLISDRIINSDIIEGDHIKLNVKGNK